MRTVRSLIILAVLGAFPFAGAQSQEAAFSISISTAQNTVKLGAPIHLQINVKNVSSGELDMPSENPPELQFHVSVTDAQGVPAALTDFGRSIRGETGGGFGSSGAGIGRGKVGFGIKPGESRKLNILVNRSYDLSRPGDYIIQVQRRDSKSKVLVKSNTIVISVVP